MTKDGKKVKLIGENLERKTTSIVRGKNVKMTTETNMLKMY